MALAGCALLVAMLLEGSSPMAIILLPPLILVFGGTFGAAITGSTLSDVRRIGSWFRLAFAPDRSSQTGTLVGLVQVLRNLEDPSVLGPLVAGAIVATLWGVLSANFLWLPMSAKILRNSDLRTRQMELLLSGVTEILAGTNPRGIRARLR